VIAALIPENGALDAVPQLASDLEASLTGG
jgi:hypothetical protein